MGTHMQLRHVGMDIAMTGCPFATVLETLESKVKRLPSTVFLGQPSWTMEIFLRASVRVLASGCAGANGAA